MPARVRRTFRPVLETLEGRCLPSTFTVSNLLDNGTAGCLRSRIAAADAHPGADTIVFMPGLEGTIRLTAGQIEISDPLTLHGPGAAKVAVDGNAADHIFLVNDGTTAEIAVTIQGLELRNGSRAAGGAILSVENLTLARTVIDGNRAGLNGGAVYAAGQLTVKQSTLSGNTSGDVGGGIFFDGDALTVDHSTISGNTSPSGAGGGLYLKAGTATVRHSVISGNTASGAGGGVYAHAATVTDLTIENTRVSDNRSALGGGGVYTGAARTTITKSTIASNSAASAGGGLRSYGSTTTVNGSVISGNTASVGGGIHQYKGSLTMTGSTVSGNHADAGRGGGVYLAVTTNAEIVSSTISGNTALKGGGVFLYRTPSAVVLHNSTITGNQAQTNGGGIYDYQSAQLNVLNCTIAFNRAGTGGSGTGGGISSDQGDIFLDSTIDAQNSAASGNPDLDSSTTIFTVRNSLFSSTTGATAFHDNGGNIIGQDPLLAPLASNGGPTQTLALKKGSPAINKGEASPDTHFDQRGPGHPRKLGPQVDIGAFERQ